jgi:hypothetical protein
MIRDRLTADLAYVWSHPHGRTAILAIATGVIGLTCHYWAGPLMLLGLRLPKGRAL